ncbi:hypothetical protein V3C97_07785 (plasmid) [Ligilactobacillus saerimneri]|uniref:hypothetical protein n=1 Tax=Ligilactobacillus saerimneri TaxID=228229 RepID=UPI0030D42A60
MTSKKMEKIKELEAKLKDYNTQLGELIAQGYTLDSSKVSGVLNRIAKTRSQIGKQIAIKSSADRKADIKRKLQIADSFLEFLATDPLAAHLGGFDHLQRVEYAPAVLKKDDPQGYKRYKAYREFTKHRSEIMNAITLDLVQEWLTEHESSVEESYGYYPEDDQSF